MKRPLLYYGANCSFTGFGVFTERLAYALSQRGWEILFHPITTWEQYGPAFQWLKDCTVHDLASVPPEVPAFNCTTPFNCPIFSNWGGRKSCTYSMYETTRLSPEQMYNTHLTDALIVPSNFSAALFTGSGYCKPVYICPLGYDPEVYTPKKERKEGPLRVGLSSMVFPSTVRKGMKDGIDAWLAVADKNDSELWVRTLHGAVPYDHPRIRNICAAMSPQEMAQWHRDIDLLLVPSRGEGFGLITLEAMACGTPSAVTFWSGSADLVNHEVAYPIEFELEPANDNFYNAGYWARPLNESMGEIICKAAADPAAVFRMGKKAAAHARRFTWDKAGDRLDAILRKIFPEGEK